MRNWGKCMKSLNEKEAVWMALSDLFIDNEINHEYIAKRVAHLTIPEIEHILFYEVAPICMSNLLVPTPTVWEGFDEDYIIPEIQQHLQEMQSNWLYNHKVLLKIRFYKVFLNKDWSKLMVKVSQEQAKQTDDL